MERRTNSVIQFVEDNLQQDYFSLRGGQFSQIQKLFPRSYEKVWGRLAHSAIDQQIEFFQDCDDILGDRKSSTEKNRLSLVTSSQIPTVVELFRKRPSIPNQSLNEPSELESPAGNKLNTIPIYAPNSRLSIQ